MEKILITGASGLVGKAIWEELKASKPKFEFICLGNKKKAEREFTHSKTRFFSIDITNHGEFNIIKGQNPVKAIIHSAGLAHQFKESDPRKFWQVNVEGAVNTALAAIDLNVRHFILISSVSVYGNVNREFEAEPVTEDFECNPKGAYAKSKLAAEEKVREICEKNQIPLTILRLATVIGEEDKGNVWRLIKSIDRRRFIWIGQGNNYKSLIYKKDVARACRLVLEKETFAGKTNIYNVAAEPVQMREIVSKIFGKLGKKAPHLKMPDEALRQMSKTIKKIFPVKKMQNAGQILEKWLSNEIFSARKIEREVDFFAKTPVLEGLEKEIDWYQNNR